MAIPVTYGINNVLGAPLGIPYGIPSQTYVSTRPKLPPPEMPGANLKRALNYLADYGGCGYYRCMAPNLLLNLNQKSVIVESTAMILDGKFYNSVEAVKFQRQATPSQKEFVKLLKSISEQKPLKLIYEVDDVVFAEEIPLYNRNRDAFTSAEIQQSIRDIIGMMDEVTVTTDYFRDFFISKTGFKNVTTVPNYLMKWWFDRYYNIGKLATGYEKNKKKPTIAIFASGTHVDVANRTNQQDDFAFVVNDIIKTRKEFNWQFYGSHPLALRPYISSGEIKFFPWVQLPTFAETMANSGAQLTFACLQNNEFNKCKSNIKLIESGALGIPCICPDMVTYKDAPLKYTHNNGNEFIDCVKAALKTQTAYVKHCKEARALADSYWLDTEENLMKYNEVYFTPYGSPERKYIKQTN
jgi:O-antigen biosynthesis protein